MLPLADLLRAEEDDCDDDEAYDGFAATHQDSDTPFKLNTIGGAGVGESIEEPSTPLMSRRHGGLDSFVKESSRLSDSGSASPSQRGSYCCCYSVWSGELFE